MNRSWLWLVVAACGGSSPEGTDPVEEPPVCEQGPPPAVGLHRLTHTEYDRTVADLLGVSTSPSVGFPPDSQAFGFAGVTSGQTTAPVLVEAWADAAERLADEVLARDLWTRRIDLGALGLDVGEPFDIAGTGDASWWSVSSQGATWQLDVDFPVAGEFRVEVEAVWVDGWQDQDRVPLPPTLVASAGTEETSVALEGVFDQVTWYTLPVQVRGGARTLELSIRRLGQGLVAVRGVKVTGPIGGWSGVDRRGRVLLCDPVADGPIPCAEETLARLVQRAWRRPPTPEELARLVGLVQLALDQGDDVEVGLRLALRAVLLSPHFLYRVESDAGFAPGTVRELSPWELATRLSYQLWRTMPDDELFTCAEEGTLVASSGDGEGAPCHARSQIERMLADPRSDVLIDDWAAQWLQLRALDAVTRDPATYPGFTAELAVAMAEETRRTLRSLREEGADLTGLLDARTTWVDPALAAHYGLDHPGDGWARVELPDARRGGLLRQGGFLTLTSQPNRASPVRRGQWVLTHLLCDPVDEPPPSVPQLDEAEVGALGDRDATARHSTDPACMSCHQELDPVGFAFNHYDGVGRWRDEDAGAPVDATGQLPDGTSFDGAGELIGLILEDERLRACMVRQYLTWAFDLGLGEDDACLVDQVTADAVAGGFSLDVFARLAATHPWTTTRTVPPAEADDAP